MKLTIHGLGLTYLREHYEAKMEEERIMYKIPNSLKEGQEKIGISLSKTHRMHEPVILLFFSSGRTNSFLLRFFSQNSAFGCFNELQLTILQLFFSCYL